MKYNITMNEERNKEIFEFEDKDHCNLLCEKLNILRKNKQFCDVILQVGTPQDIHEIYGHRAILASASRYFLDVFTNDITNAPCGIPQFQLYKLLSTKYDVVAFNHILDFIYTSRLEIPKKHVRNVYALASRLKMTTIAQKCGEFLASTLTPETCLYVRSTNGVLNDPMLLSSVDNYIKENIAEVIKCKFVEQLEKIKIEVLQNSDEEIDSVNPRHLFNMISDWIKKEFEENKMSNNQLLLKTYMLYLNTVDRSLHDCLDIENGDYNYSELIVEYKDLSRKLSATKRSTENVDANNFKNISIKTESNGATKLNETQDLEKDNNLKTTKNIDETNHSVIQSLMKNNNKNIAPSKPKQFLFTRSDSDSSLSSIADEDENDWKVLAVDVTTKNNMNGLLMVAGKLYLLTVKLKLHSPHSSRNNSIEKPEICSTLANMNNVRCALGSACLNDQLVVCGGYDRSNCLNSVEAYDSTQNKWIYFPSMNKARARFSVTVLDNKIYAVGGSDGQKELKSAEVYDPIEKNWKFIAKSPIGRSNASVCTLNGEIYLIGGWNGQTGLQRCDVYNPKTDTWRRISDLQIGRYQVSVTVLNNQIYAVGGCGTWTCLNSVERYDLDKDEWSLIQPMHTARRGCGVIAFENKIYVIGGHDGTYSLCSCEIYNLKENTWSKGPSLTVCRANVAVSVVKETIYAVGGFSGKNFLNSFEYLDFKNNEWTTFLKKGIKNPTSKLIDNLPLETKYEINGDRKNELNDHQTNGDHLLLNGNSCNNSGFSKSKEPLIEVEGETAVETN